MRFVLLLRIRLSLVPERTDKSVHLCLNIFTKVHHISTRLTKYANNFVAVVIAVIIVAITGTMSEDDAHLKQEYCLLKR